METAFKNANTLPGAPARQVAALSPATKLNNGSWADATGGDPAKLSDSIYVCSRSDSDPDRSAAELAAAGL